MASKVQQLQLLPGAPLRSRLRSDPPSRVAEEHHRGAQGVLRSHRQLFFVQSLQTSSRRIKVTNVLFVLLYNYLIDI